jgi:hypothetical protein
MTDNKYQYGKIYKIISNQTDEIYIGSTYQVYLSMRMRQHRGNFNSWKNGTRKFVSSYEIIKYPDCQIILIEKYPCFTKDELRAREQHHINLNPNCVNRQNAITTDEERKIKMLEYNKKYRELHDEKIKQRLLKWNEDNKEHVQQKAKQRYIENKEQISIKSKAYRDAHHEKILIRARDYHHQNKEWIKEKRNARELCPDCGKEYSHANKRVHIKTPYHLKFIVMDNQIKETQKEYDNIMAEIIKPNNK